MEYLRQGDLPNAEEQSRKIIDLDASRGEGWLLKAATTFDIAQADQAFATGLRCISETERREFALIFKPLALYVWKKANSMLVRDAGRPGMSRAAKQHYEIKAKAAQLSAFAIELFPLSGWQEELTKYLPVKAWGEYTEAERIEIFDMLTRFDSKASSDLDAFIRCRERLINSLALKLPEEHAALFGRVAGQGNSTASSASSAQHPRPVEPRPSAGLGCGGWTVLVFILIFLIGIVGSLVTGDKEAPSQEQPHRRLTPHEFGWGMGRELLKSATTDSGSGGMVIFAQGCRAENPTVKTYTNAEYQQFLNGLIDAYAEWRRNGYVVLNTEIRDRTPSVAAPVNTPADTPPPKPAPPTVAQSSEKSPLGDLLVDRSNREEIWLVCVEDSRHPEQLCEHDWRTGQVSFSPDERWIVVADGGGPGSSMGTELRLFQRDEQNIYHEIEDAGIAEAATRIALQSKHVPDTVELGHVYAEVEGWSVDGQTLKLRIWGHGPGYPEDGSLEPTQVDYDTAALQVNRHSETAAAANNAPPETDNSAEDVRTAAAARDHADAELNEVYKRVMGGLAPAQHKLLREDERVWLKWRDGEAERVALNSSSQGNGYRVKNLVALTDLIQKRSQILAATPGKLAVSAPSATAPAVDAVSSTGLQKRLPNGGVADPYANYVAVRPQAAQPPRQTPAVLSRVYTIPELKKLVGTRPAGAGLRGDFVLVSREGDQLLLQSRVELSNFGITSTANGQPDVYRGHTFVTVACTRDINKLINGQLVTIPAEQALRIISVSKNVQGRIDVEASF